MKDRWTQAHLEFETSGPDPDLSLLGDGGSNRASGLSVGGSRGGG